MSEMEIPIKYNPAEGEDRWYKYWMDITFLSTPEEHECSFIQFFNT